MVKMDLKKEMKITRTIENLILLPGQAEEAETNNGEAIVSKKIYTKVFSVCNRKLPNKLGSMQNFQSREWIF